MNIERVLLEKLEKVERDIEQIKAYLVRMDSFLTRDDKEALEKAREELQRGETITLEALKKKMGVNV